MNIAYKCNSETERLEVYQKLIELGWIIRDNISHNSFHEKPYLNIDDEYYGDGIGYIFVHSSIADNDSPTQVYCKEHILIPFKKKVSEPKPETFLVPNRFSFTNKNLLVTMTCMSDVTWYFEVKFNHQLQKGILSTFRLKVEENELPDMDNVNEMVEHLAKFTSILDEFSSEAE